MNRLLVAVHDSETRSHLKSLLLEASVGTVEIVEDGPAALRCLVRSAYDLIVVDFGLPDECGRRLMTWLRQTGIPIEVIVLVENVSLQDIIFVVKAGAADVLQKPLSRTEFVDSLLRSLERRRRTPHYLASRMNLYLCENSHERSLRMTDLCKRFRISRSHAARLLQKHLNTTFRDRLVQHRVEKAKKLLATTDCPVHRIAVKCGFRNSKRLAESFRRIVGTTPVQYRQSAYAWN